MKNKFTYALMSLLVIVSSFSCTPDYKQYNNPDPVPDMLVQSGWSIQLIDMNRPSANDYSGYTALFDSHGSALCKINNEKFPGSWRYNNEVFDVQFESTDANISAFNKHWKVASSSSSVIKFVGTDQSNYQLVLSRL